MTAVSFAGIKSSNPTDRDLSDLYYVVEYLRATQDMDHILHTPKMTALRLYCEVDASYLLHPDNKGHTGYTISFYGTIGTFHNRSIKQTAVATSSNTQKLGLSSPSRKNSTSLSPSARNCRYL